MNKLIETKYGMVEGFEENGLLKFLGIPYAAQPRGELRWKRARECEKWDGVLKADHYGEVAWQEDKGEYQGGDDCLTINVVRPTEGEKLPVFVWIHGGGYMCGSCSDSLYHGESFAKDGVIYVNFQYRLNVLGFFDFSTYEGCEEFETNRGLSDMIMALKWIHENIAAFGGDPDRVTIAGESAGGAAVVTLMAVPAVKGYFHQVIAESALCNCVMTPQMQRKNVDIFLEGMGWSKEELAGKLKTAHPYDLIKAARYQEKVHQYRYPGIFEPGPVIDDLLPERPIDAIRKGCAEGVKLIIGTNLHEGTMFVRPEDTGFPNSWEMVHEMFENNGHLDCYDAVKEYYDDPAKEEKNGVKYLRPSMRTIGEIYSIGLPAIIAQALLSFMTYGLNIILGGISEAVVTAYGLYYKIQQFILFAAFGLRDAITPIVSFNYGMQSKKRVNEGIRYGMIYTLIVMLAGMIVLEAFAVPFAAIFGLSGETQALCVQAMQIVSLSFLFAGANIAYQGTFQALDAGYMWLVWFTFLIAELLSAVIATILMKKIRRRTIDKRQKVSYNRIS